MGPDVITAIFNRIVLDGVPETWRKCKIISVYKNQAGIMSCINYRGIKLISHSMKLFERILEATMKSMTVIKPNNFGFQKAK